MKNTDAMLVTLLFLSSCGSDAQQGRPPAFIAGGVPREACTDLPPTQISAHGETLVVDTAMSVGTYEPGRVVDVATNEAGDLFVLDAFQARVARITGSGSLTTVWGRKGPGPGEFNEPQAIGVRGELVYVLDGDGIVSVFDTNGKYLKDIRTWLRGQDLAILPNGDVVIANEMRPFGSEEEGVVVFDTAGKRKAVLLTLDSTSYGRRPQTGPAGTKLRVFAGGDGRLAVAYVSDNSVDVFRNGTLETRIRGCMPSEVLNFYSRVYEHNKKSRTTRAQSLRIVVSGVYLDRSGDIVVSSPGGWDDIADITIYDRTGIPKQSLQFREGEPVRFASDALFADRRHVIAWDGSVWKWALTY